MKQKGTVKKAGAPPNFWGKHQNKVPLDFQKWIYDQYFDRDTLSVYCDSSGALDIREMALACSFLLDGNITVKYQLIFPPKECVHKTVYGELKAVLFGLNNFLKYLNNGCRRVIIYTDVGQMEDFLLNEKSFKNETLNRLLREIMLRYEYMKRNHAKLSIEIKHLSPSRKKNNPFAKTSHNAAKKLLGSVRTRK